MDVILFLVFAIIAVVCAINVVVQTHPISSAVSLVGVMASLAVLYLLLGAEFLAAAQVIVYAGAIMVLFVFVIMLVNLDVSMRQVQFNRQGFVAGALALVLAAQFLFAIWAGRGALRLPAMATEISPKNTEAVADALFSHYMLPFEIASILLLVAMIGAVVMAKRRVE
jgi:NADH-quinone oxidoreductase subunit J